MNNSESNNLWSALTLVVWAGCVAVGVVGLRLAYPRPQPVQPSPAPVEATVLNVEVNTIRVAASAPGAPRPKGPEIAPTPLPPLLPLPEPMGLPRIARAEAPPAMTALTTLTPFPERVRAAPATQALAPTSRPALVAEQLTLGVGEGVQPMPEYPREAQLARQEGVVVVRFSVDQNGRVGNVQASSPSPWPLLNQAAVRAVRDTWRFPLGSPRLFDVSIRFQLRKNN